MSEERWRWVDGYEGLYMVSNQGRVMSVPCTQKRGNHSYRKPGMIIHDQNNGKGYRVVSLYSEGTQKQFTVHRLVAQAFIPNELGKPEVNHIDGNKANNNVTNLEWVTKTENMRHASEVLDALGFNRKLTKDEVVAIRQSDDSETSLACKYGVTQAVISAVITGKTYRAYPGETKMVGQSRTRKLTSDAVTEIRSSNATGKELAKRYGVATSTISKVRNNKRYKEEIA